MGTLQRFLSRNLLWIVFAVFAIIGIVTKQDASLFVSEGPYGYGKYVLWALFFGFFGFTLYCNSQESFFKSIRRMSEMYWGWQVGLDLYIGLLLPLLIIYMQGGTVVFLIWLVPIIINANLFTLLYFAINYDSVVAHFML